MIFSYVLRSSLAHAAIRSIDAAAARGMPGVLLVLTGADVTEESLGDVPCLVPLQNRDGSPRHDTPRPVLATTRCATSASRSRWWSPRRSPRQRDAAEAIVVDYEELPAVVDARAAIEPGRTAAVRRHFPQYRVRLGQRHQRFRRHRGGVRPRRPRHTLELVNNRVVANSMEPRNAAVGTRRAADPCSTRPRRARISCAILAEQVLKLPKEKVRSSRRRTSAAASA